MPPAATDAQVLHTWPADYFRGPFIPGYFGIAFVGNRLYAKVASSTYSEAALEAFDTMGASVAGPVKEVGFSSVLKSAPGVVSAASQGTVSYFDLNTLSATKYTIPDASVASPMVIDTDGSWTTLTGIGGICGSDTRLQRISTKGERVVDVSLTELFPPTTLACESPSLVVLNDASTVIGTWRASRSILQLDLVDSKGDIRHLGDISSISGYAIFHSDGAGHLVVAYNKHVDCQDGDVVKSCEQAFVDVYGADGDVRSTSFGGTIKNSDFPVHLSVNDGSVGIQYSRWHDAGHAGGVLQYSAIALALQTTREAWHDPAPESPSGVGSRSIKYVALGDSYSSGEGVEPFFEPDNRCHRSKQAYSTLVEQPGYPGISIYSQASKAGSDVQWGFQACSGATTENLLETGRFGDRLPQLKTDRTLDIANDNDLPVDEQTDLVTLTIGGNNVHFEEVLSSCFWSRDCTKQKYDGVSLASYLRSQRDALSPELDKVYERIHRQAPDARLLVLGYPQFFPATAREQNCWKLRQYDAKVVIGGIPIRRSIGFSQTEQNYLRQAASELNQTLADRVRAAGEFATFIPVDSRFAGHEICGNDDEWINAGTLRNVKLSGDEAFVGPNDQSFHPNESGHQLGYADAVNDWLNQIPEF